MKSELSGKSSPNFATDKLADEIRTIGEYGALLQRQGYGDGLVPDNDLNPSPLKIMQRIQALELRVHFLENRISELERDRPANHRSRPIGH